MITAMDKYAISALVYIDKAQDRVMITDMVKDIGVDRSTLEQVLIKLRNGGLVKAYRGRSVGGYRLNKTLDNIYLADVRKSIVSPKKKNRGLSTGNINIDEGPVGVFCEQLRRGHEDAINNIRLSDIVVPSTTQIQLPEENHGKCELCRFYRCKDNVKVMRHTCRKCVDGNRWKRA